MLSTQVSDGQKKLLLRVSCLHFRLFLQQSCHIAKVADLLIPR